MSDSPQSTTAELVCGLAGDGEMARALVDNSNDFIGLASLEGQILFINPAGRRLLGLDEPERAQAAKIADCVIEEDRHKVVQDILPTVARDGRWDGEMRFRHFKTGAAIPMLQQVFVIKEAGSDRPLALATISRDITRRENAETEVAHMTRISILGELTASIAHEINQPLGAIVNNGNVGLRVAAALPGFPGAVRELLSDIVEDAKRASDIIARIRTLTRRAAPNKTPLRLRDVVEDVLALAQRELAERGILVRTEIPHGLPRVSGDRVQLQQVLLNLVVNGIETMSEIEPERRILLIAGRLDELIGRPAVRIIVRDFGKGLRPEDSERLFESFYTTKPKGMGMGLRISRSIVEAHGGRLWGAANEGPIQGATFSCLLPAERQD